MTQGGLFKPSIRLQRWRTGKTLAAVGLDIIIVSAAYATAFVLRFEGRVPASHVNTFQFALLPIVTMFVLSNVAFGMYRQLWRFASAQEVTSIGMATGVPTALLFVLELVLFDKRPVPLSVVIMGGVLTGVGLTISRYQSRLVTGFLGRFEHMLGMSHDRQRVLIVGAGEAGQLVARHLSKPDVRAQYELVGYIDDGPDKIGRRVLGGMVLGSREKIGRIAEERSVDLIVIAIHRISGEAIRDIITRCEGTHARLKVLPRSMVDFDQLGISLALRDIEPEDLMGRASLNLDYDACQTLVEGRRVLVTGAAGSIGSEMCRQLVAFLPETLIMLDINESGLYDLRNEIISLLQTDVQIILADVTDKARLLQYFERHKPHVVFHAAAYKHVPILEDYPQEAIRVNVLGTRNVLELSREYGVERVVVVSTDKAVAPSSVMGASKLLAEQLVAAQQNHNGTRFAVVRFGNVINSRGSVVPLFVQQIKRREPITITHPDVTRYFMSIPEAVSLVIQAATLANDEGNALFVLDMGEPIRIEDLARKLVRMHGLRVEDVEFEYTGLRPGEKMHEALTAEHETIVPTESQKVWRVRQNPALHHGDVMAAIDELIALAENGDTEQVKRKLATMTGLEPCAHSQTDGLTPASRPVPESKATRSAHSASGPAARGESLPTSSPV